jgi:outer membrane protein OmpA-like peptidoglycan-associated protein
MLCVSSYFVTSFDVVQQPLENGHAEGDLGGAEARLLGPPEPRAVVVEQGHLSHAALSLAQANGHFQLSAKQQQSKSHQNLFKNNGSKLAPESHAELDTIAQTLIDHPQATVNIVGHTDSSGSAAYNQKISEARAESVSAYLKTKGVKESQINASGEGESNPIASNKTAAGRSENRRVDIDIPNFEY